MKNINYVVNLVQLDLQDYTTHNVSRIRQYCIHCVKNALRYKVDKSVDVAYLTPNAAGNAPFPKDYEYYTKVAVNVGGQLVTLTMNRDIPLVRKYDECQNELPPNFTGGDLSLDPFLYAYGYYYAPHYRNGMYVGEMYSMGGGYNEMGYFRVDHQLRQFQFYNVPTTEIVLEYVADKETSGSTLIPNKDVEVIRAYTHWQLAEYDKTIPGHEKTRKLGLFNAAMDKREDIEFIASISDYLDNAYAGSKSGPKR